MSTLGALQRSINLRTCAPELVFAGIDGLDPLIPTPDDPSQFIVFGLTQAFPAVSITLFGLFSSELEFELWGPPDFPPVIQANTLERPALETAILALPDPQGKNVGAVQLTLTATQFPGPGEQNPQSWGVVARMGGCSQILGVVEVGDPAPANCPAIESVSPTIVISGLINALVITGQNLTEPFTLVAFDALDVPYPAVLSGPPSPGSASVSLDLSGGANAGAGRLVLTPGDPLCPPTEIPLTFQSA